MKRMIEADEVEQAEKNMRMQKPYDNIDLSYLETEPAYGKEAEPDFYDRLKKVSQNWEYVYDKQGNLKVDENGQPVKYVKVVNLWGELGFYLRDIRLGNLGELNGDVAYVEHYLDLAKDLLNMQCVSSFTTAFSRAVTKLEVSQSKGGFYRKNKNTFRKQMSYKEEPKDKNLLGGEREE